MFGVIERRRHRRILTLKNFAWFAGALAIIFVILSFDIFTRGGGAGDYGRLMNRRLPPEDVHPRPQQVVTEAPPVPDQTAADPLLLAPAAREQEFLSPQKPAPVVVQATATPVVTTQGGGRGVSIVGDGEGVVIVRGSDAKRPTLAGGIFKQH